MGAVIRSLDDGDGDSSVDADEGLGDRLGLLPNGRGGRRRSVPRAGEDGLEMGPTRSGFWARITVRATLSWAGNGKKNEKMRSWLRSP